MNIYAIQARKGCPFCHIPPVEHETHPGHLHWVWVCPNAPRGWKGTFYDRPVQPAGVGEGRP